MTDTQDNAEQAVAAAPDAEPAATVPAESSEVRRGRGVIAPLALVLALAAAGFSGYQWVRDRSEKDTLQREISGQLTDVETRNKDAMTRVEQATEALKEAAVKLGSLETTLAQSQSRQSALETRYQDLSRNRDEWAFTEVEQSVLLASQQLRIVGNVRAALIVLENAEVRLQRMDQSRFGALRRALGNDIERLKALPLIDDHGATAGIDELFAAVDGLRLAMDARARPEARQPAPAAELPAWERMLREAWQELRELVRVQRVDRQEAALLAPEQAFFLRENLKLRLLGARVALLSRDAKSYQGDLRAALAMVERHFDVNNATVSAAAATLRKLQGMPVQVDVPKLTETLEVLRKLRLSLAKTPA